MRGNRGFGITCNKSRKRFRTLDRNKSTSFIWSFIVVSKARSNSGALPKCRKFSGIYWKGFDNILLRFSILNNVTGNEVVAGSKVGRKTLFVIIHIQKH